MSFVRDRRKFLGFLMLNGSTLLLPSVLTSKTKLYSLNKAITASDDYNYILVNSDFSGTFRNEGYHQLLSAMISAEILNSEVAGKKWAIIASDNKCDPKLVESGINTALSKKAKSAVKIIVGGSSSRVCLEQQKIAKANNWLHIPGNAQAINEEFDKNSFLPLVHSNEESTKAIFKTIKENYPEAPVASITDAYLWGKQQLATQQKLARLHGIELTNTYINLYKRPDQHNRHPIYNVIGKFVAEHELFIVNRYSHLLPDLLNFIHQFPDDKKRKVFLPAISDTNLQALSKLPSKDVWLVSPQFNTPSLKNSQFSSRFKELSGTYPQHSAIQTYSQLMIFKAALNKVKEFDVQRIISASNKLSAKDINESILEFKRYKNRRVPKISMARYNTDIDKQLTLSTPTIKLFS